MVYVFGEKSLCSLSTCDEKLQEVANGIIKKMDITVLEGYRSNERQQKLFNEKKTKLLPGKSKHNLFPSLAMDIAPYKDGIDWTDYERFAYMAGLAVGIGSGLGIKIRWGGDWDGDGELSDNRFNDLPHIELCL